MMGQDPHAWFIAPLDGFLSESLRRAPPVELSRARLLVGVCCGLLACDLLALLYLWSKPGSPWGIVAVCWICLVGFGAALMQLRQSSSTRYVALLLCTLMTLGILISILHMRSLALATHASIMLIPVVSVYLVGWRLGLLFSALTSVSVGLVFPLYAVDAPTFSEWGRCAFAAFYVLCAWAVGWLFVLARDEAQATVERTLRTLGESEGKLVSLIESTDDLILSLDAEERVLTANDTARRLFRQLAGRELLPGEPAFNLSTREDQGFWRELLARALGGERVRQEKLISLGEGTFTMELLLSPVWGEGKRVVGTTLIGRDITVRKQAEARLSEMHRSLLEVSRQAGMAEIATGVLHNVGNALNSVNVAAGVVTERLLGMHVPSMGRAAQLLDEHSADLGAFFTSDPRGRQFPAYLKLLSRQLAQEREAALTEMHTLCSSVDHIKAVVSMQQRHARHSEVVESLPVPELLDDALRLHSLSFEQVGIQVRREYVPLPPVWGDRHKLLQILLNLLSNARHALLEGDSPERLLTLRVGPGTGGRLRIEVADTGIGVAPEHLPRLFTQGFTTKKDGHGFGLHISALAAEEMHGSLSCVSAGRGQGATFILELPAGDAPPAYVALGEAVAQEACAG
ncbi:PAS domain S-box protein [Archangium violaceum]|uniref:ATP-binding protein n=1 Tax=Archangium violaceum TaxID=83451 RepID=UPI00194E3876|nr:ATP-binding protein [Archangium violaceum]QRN93431.1 PAS domain S-box protein [Archangium violaceum]